MRNPYGEGLSEFWDLKDADADITVIAPEGEWTVDRELFRSRGKNSPFHNWTLKGKAALTIVGGVIRCRDC
jgi:dihydroorotase